MELPYFKELRSEEIMREIRMSRLMSIYTPVGSVPVMTTKKERHLRRTKSMAAPPARKWTPTSMSRAQTLQPTSSTEVLL